VHAQPAVFEEDPGELRPASSVEDKGEYEAWSPEVSAQAIAAGFVKAVEGLNAAATHDTPQWHLFDDLRGIPEITPITRPENLAP